jgi:GTP:adenosylcobinamide-phosphate guanylyltransferase
MAGVTSVVLAGGPPDDVARLEPGAPNKAFVRIGGVTLLERTLRALRSAQSIDRIIVVAPPAAQVHPALALADERRNDGDKIRVSLRNGLEGLPQDDLVLVSASDLPVLTAPSVDDFVARARAIDPDLGYGCLERSVHEAAFPDVPHTWARLRDGTYCGGGFIAIKPRAMPNLERFIERLGAARKNVFRLASLFGWDMLARFAIGRLSIANAETRASHLLHAPVRAIVSPYPETAVNVDRVSDVALAEQLLGRTPALE